jgi:DNA (cytosine-5)-methyltransferase 1
VKLLDMFCGAGGAGMGYHRAGFEVVGVDIKPQKHYPFHFILGDALDILRRMIEGEKFLATDGLWYGIDDFDVIHASPPCQKYSAMRKGRWQDREHPDLVAPTRAILKSIGKPYIIENVMGAPLIDPVMLCGTMFGLQTKAGSQLRRHRIFETSFPIVELLPPCNHAKVSSVIGVYGGGPHPQRRRIPATIGVYGHSGGSSKRDYLDFSCFTTNDRRDAMGIDWMTGNELSQAIPPAYTLWIGKQIMEAMK